MANRRRKRRRRPYQLSPPGASPGIVISDPAAQKPTVDVIAYNPSEYIEQPVEKLEELQALHSRFSVTWLNIDGLADADLIKKVGDLYGFHRLALEDVVNVHQRAKMEQYGDHHFLVTRMILTGDHFETEQFSIFVGSNYVVTFQEKPGDCLEPVRARIRSSRGRIRKAGPDYLVYALLDAVIDAYFPVIEHYAEKMDELEDEIIHAHHPETIARIHDIKRDLINLRRTVWPLREVLNSLIRDANPMITEETRVYLRDCYDHVLRIVDLVENYRELAGDLMELYMSMGSQRMNEVIKVLTIISTIFIPLTFIVGVYGMNFDPDSSPYNMPELRWYYGYPVTLLCMLILVLFMLVYFRRKGWVGRSRFSPDVALR